MSSAHEFHQIHLPPSFTDLYKDPTRAYAKPSLPFAEICERYEWCEDMAQMLCEPALNQMASLHITEEDVMERTFRGLLLSPEVMSAKECMWVLQRLCELLNWTVDDLKPKLEAALAQFERSPKDAEASNAANSPDASAP
jgi:hypothetical protein